ncbi:hypothetical protein IM660_05585 [Ruania alkalisoli]|uniref:Antitoxin FitA-like ribbon-helix-helix domain-containing protein n=1 Tax=Ruania alkalisoli TaxID=2779775 RepID=A0A7M1SVX9_9MICO|nr:hypothetical protein [Ruania alkalisoli]QOR71746.1 hypothetical protein IM660_05585 [Ruania alkalisoli]
MSSGTRGCGVIHDLPDELHAALRQRARSEGMTMSDYVSKVLERDLSRPTVAEWVARQRGGPTRENDVMSALGAVRERALVADVEIRLIT